jgi:uncharacterized protein YbjT (DUF2867 family)
MRAVILVAGATGNVGRHVVSELLGVGVEVRALTRNPDGAGLPIDADLVRGDLSKPDTLRAALSGVTAVFLVWPFLSARAARSVVEAIDGHASRIVYLSSMSVRDGINRQNDPISSFHFEVERLISRSRLQWTFLRPSGFATNTLVWAPQIRAGSTVRWPYGGARRSLIDERDIAAVAACALLDERHAGQKYLLSGPHALTQVEQLELIAEAIGRQLRYEEIPPAAARRALLTAWGIPRIVARLLPAATLPRRIADGALAAQAKMLSEAEPVTDTVEEVTGTPARTFAHWASNHAHDFR